MPNQVERANNYDRRGGRKGPMGDMNVTPFIDVLLVLIIMLIMVVPIATHETQVDLPGQSCPDCISDPITNTVSITSNDQLLWNGKPVTRERLKLEVTYAAAMDEEPLLRFEPADLASYDQASRTIALIKDAGATRFAFVGNERHKDFER